MDYFDWDNKDGFFPVDLQNATTDDDDDPIDFNNIFLPNDESQDIKPTIIDRIKNELGITKEEFDRFISKIKAKEKDKKETYVKRVLIPKSGTKTRCTICSRRYVSLKDEALIFEIALYHFTYGKKFSRSIVSKLHNKICSNLDIGKMRRDDSRSIKHYFNRYLNKGFEIIREARKYIIDHPEFIDVIKEDKLKNKNK